MKYSEIVSERIRSYCSENNITVNKLATQSGIKQSTIDNILKNNTKNPSLRTVHHLAQGMDMTLSEFFDFKEMNETIFDD